jgi:S-DNA-T family DNA segregation ATPase FtsK/SpoIIIE
MIDYARLRTDLLALAVFAATVFLALCLASFHPADTAAGLVWPVAQTPSNLCGPVGAMAAATLLGWLGLGSWFVLVGVMVFDYRLFRDRGYSDPATRLCGAVLVLLSLCGTVQILIPGWPTGSVSGSGGLLGAYFAVILGEHLSHTGSLILLAAVGTAGLMLTGEWGLLRAAVALSVLPLKIMIRVMLWALPKPRAEQEHVEPAIEVEAVAEEPVASPVIEPVVQPTFQPVVKQPVVKQPVIFAPDDVEESAQVEDVVPVQAAIKVNPPVRLNSDREKVLAALDAGEVQESRPHALPDWNLLNDAEEFPYEELAKKAQGVAATLEKTFQEFGLNVKVVEVDTGPVITQYELELEAGLRLNKVTALAEDLAIALRVPSVRVVAPIPGKNTVGVEVPNDVRVMVRLKELLECAGEQLDKVRLPLFLGKDVSGHPLLVDLCKMPHLLIAGRTGTGKSVCLNTLILSLLMTRTPDQVKMLMIDPKMVELSPYMRIPHLMHPVITDMKKAEAVLGWAVDKMEERYDLLARVGVRHLDSYNKLGKDAILQKLGIDRLSEEAERVPDQMPYIVIVADEMADMMMTSGKDVEAHIIRLAQKSRAVGIHLVLATQKPTVDVITGLIKSNLPSRIAFQVSSRVDSRVVLDEMGAEKLLGNGDMLYLAPGTSNLYRAQGTFVSDEEVNTVIEFFSDQEPQYSTEIAQVTAAAKTGGKTNSEPRERDDLYDQACEIVIREGRGSTSLLQRAMGIGYGRAARMIDWMAEDGIVGAYNGSQAREVGITMEQWEEMRDGNLVSA